MNATRSVMMRSSLLKRYAITIVALLVLCGCPVKLVQPYDEKLLNDTELIYKKASALADQGILKSPKTDKERLAIDNPAAHEAHYVKFESSYDSLIRDADALILRSLAKSGEVGAAGNKLQEKIEALIESSIPSVCPDQDKEMKNLSASLTVRNYIDLKCFFMNWKAQHSDMVATENTQIMKKGNWEARKKAVFNIVLTIQKAEGFKKQ